MEELQDKFARLAHHAQRRAIQNLSNWASEQDPKPDTATLVHYMHLVDTVNDVPNKQLTADTFVKLLEIRLGGIKTIDEIMGRFREELTLHDELPEHVQRFTSLPFATQTTVIQTVIQDAANTTDNKLELLELGRVMGVLCNAADRCYAYAVLAGEFGQDAVEQAITEQEGTDDIGAST